MIIRNPQVREMIVISKPLLKRVPGAHRAWHLLRNLKRKAARLPTAGRNYKISYSQLGEDLIVDFIFSVLKIEKPSYLDIGAYQAINLSNTYLFFQRGCRGVCVEPDPTLFYKLAKVRKGDICLNVGVGTGQENKANFYVMSARTLNTFSKEEAERYQSYGTYKIEKVIQIPLISVNTIMKQYFASWPNFISLDVEGLELEILKTFDFAQFRPEVFCIETLTYTEDKSETKATETIDYLVSKGYFLYGDTFLNSIFVNTEAWKNRPLVTKSKREK